jgi:hypothetical protein
MEFSKAREKRKNPEKNVEGQFSFRRQAASVIFSINDAFHHPFHRHCLQNLLCVRFRNVRPISARFVSLALLAKSLQAPHFQ